MLVLDYNIRGIAKDIYFEPNEYAQVTYFLEDDQKKEAQKICEICKSLLNQYFDKKIAILVRQRSKNVDIIINTLKANNINFFYALFSDEDKEYIEFHKVALKVFFKIIKNKKLTKSLINLLIESINSEVNIENNDLRSALIELFSLFWNRAVFGEYNYLDKSEKIDFLRNILENNSLKQYIGHLDHNIVITTVHGAKGLEWDFVIMPDLEQYLFPNSHVCISCNNQKSCQVDLKKIKNDIFFNELSVFYVAVTRAKIKNIFTASKKRISSNGIEKETNESCFLYLPGIKLIQDI